MNDDQADENETQPTDPQREPSGPSEPSESDPSSTDTAVEDGLDEQDPIEYIKYMLESKSTAKQTTFKYLREAFSGLSGEARRIIHELDNRAGSVDDDVTLYFRNISNHEFQVKLAGDLLIFVLHTNIVTFDDEHPVIKSPYISGNEVNRYFGQINIYNFMYDSLRYNRGHDPGYLIGRLMINHENRFFMEGEPQFTKAFGDISDGSIQEDDLQRIVKLSLQVAIRNDLIAPPYNKVRSITLNQKNEHTLEMGGGQKIGFRMSYEHKMEWRGE